MDDNKDIEEIREILEQNTKLLEQNNRILRKVHRNMRNTMIFRIFYWAVIIGSMFGIYYYMQPFISNITGVYTELITLPEKLKIW